MNLLKVKDLTIKFGGLVAVSNVNIDINQGEVIGLIGPNGAGKTTVFNMLTGVYKPTEGTIELIDEGGKSKYLEGKPPYKINQLGLARTFQNIRLFKQLTVFTNVKIAYHQYTKYNLLHTFFRLPKFFREEKAADEKVEELLKIFNLYDSKDLLASNLPYGQQRKLEIARALASGPRLLLLDEPAAGMNPQETADLTELIGFIKEKFNITILLIEHDMSLVMKICDRIYVLDHGRLIANGTPSEIQKNKKVINAYLGEEV